MDNTITSSAVINNSLPLKQVSKSTQTDGTLLNFQDDYNIASLFNKNIMSQNKELIKELAIFRGAVVRLENTIELCHIRIDELQLKIEW